MYLATRCYIKGLMHFSDICSLAYTTHKYVTYVTSKA